MKIGKFRKIPTLIGLVIIFVGLSISIFLIEKSQRLLLKARTDNAPNRVRISNINQNSITVSWFTAEPAAGQVKYGFDPQILNMEAVDERDLNSNSKGKYYSHYFNLSNLDPATTYYLEIYSNSDGYDNNGQPYQVTTAVNLPQVPDTSRMTYGLVLQQDEKPAEGAIVYLNAGYSTLQSALVSSSGNWTIPLHLARTNNLSNYLEYDDSTSVEIFVQDKEQTASAIATVSNNPIPSITLGKSYDFREKQHQLTEATPSSGFNLDNIPFEPASDTLTIINPQNGEKISTSKPEFFGKAPLNTELTIEVQSPTYFDKLTTNEWGDWNWEVPKNLEPGDHTITISYLDKEGILQSISHSFTVLAAENSELPSFTSTPSASPTERPSPTATATKTLTPSPTEVASTTATPTVRPTVRLEATNTPTPISSAAGEIIPGFMVPTYIIFVVGLLFIAGGIIFSLG